MKKQTIKTSAIMTSMKEKKKEEKRKRKNVYDTYPRKLYVVALSINIQ